MSVIDMTGAAERKRKKKQKRNKQQEFGTDIAVTKDSYVIVRRGSKNYLGFAFNPERNRCLIELQNGEEETIEYDNDTLLAALGTKPKMGQTAFGVKIQPVLGSKDLPIGKVVYRRELTDLDKKAFTSAMKRTYKAMRDQRLDIFPIGKITLLPKKGRYAGMYYYRRKGDEVFDSIELHPDSFEDRKYNEYILYHEYAHAIWYKKLEQHVRAKWVKAFQKRIEPELHKQRSMEAMLKELMEAQVLVQDFRKELDDEGKALFKEVLSHYKRYHRLDPKAMNLLLTEDSNKFAELWPTRMTTIKNVKHDISEYASTSTEEFFAEAFAYHMTGRTLPKDITKLLNYTVKSVY